MGLVITSTALSLMAERAQPPGRAELLRRTKELFGRAGHGEWLSSTEVDTHRHLALLLGGARSLPAALTTKLVVAFDETCGYWYARPCVFIPQGYSGFSAGVQIRAVTRA